jgi:hypothetical protein
MDYLSTSSSSIWHSVVLHSVTNTAYLVAFIVLYSFTSVSTVQLDVHQSSNFPYLFIFVDDLVIKHRLTAV